MDVYVLQQEMGGVLGMPFLMDFVINVACQCYFCDFCYMMAIGNEIVICLLLAWLGLN